MKDVEQVLKASHSNENMLVEPVATSTEKGATGATHSSSSNDDKIQGFKLPNLLVDEVDQKAVV
jgi:hypothetical protein